MAAIISFVAGHWRLTLGLLLAVGLYVQHLKLDAANSARDAAVAQETLWKNTADQQTASIKALHDASDARDKTAQQAVSDAISQARADDDALKRILASEPKPGQDRCKAAQALIWQVIGGSGATASH